MTNSSERRLILDPMARIIPFPNGIHLVQRRSVVDIRGKDVERLHQRLAPVLDGRFTRDQILASVGTRASRLERYLKTLSESGVLFEGKLPQNLPEGFPRAMPGLQRLEHDGRRVDVTLAGSESFDARALRLSCASRAEVEQRLLRLKRSGLDGGRVWIICDHDPNSEELARRAAIARHLLALELGRRGEPRLMIFELTAHRLTLCKLAMAGPLTEPMSSVPLQMGLVRMLDCAQLPLSVYEAELAGLGTRGLCWGLNALEVRDTLMIEFLGREALRYQAYHGIVEGERRLIGKACVEQPRVRLTPHQAARAVVDVSRARCHERLLCESVVTLDDGHGRELDLLAAPPPSPRVSVLQDLLRRRGKGVNGLLDERFAPLFVLHSNAHIVSRLGFEETLFQTLLTTAADALGVNESDGFSCAPSLCHRTTIDRRLSAAADRLLDRLPIISGHLQWLGQRLTFALRAEDEPDK